LRPAETLGGFLPRFFPADEDGELFDDEQPAARRATAASQCLRRMVKHLLWITPADRDRSRWRGRLDRGTRAARISAGCQLA